MSRKMRAIAFGALVLASTGLSACHFENGQLVKDPGDDTWLQCQILPNAPGCPGWKPW